MITAAMQRTLPSSAYRDPDLWAREREAVFARTWQLLGHESEAAAPGDWLAGDVAGRPVLAVRGEDGGFRAFHNVCRHRAGPLVEGARGRCEGELVCRYHGWRYALDGRLKSATGFGPAAGFDPRDFPLFDVRVERWRGFLFVSLDADAAPLASTTAPLEALFVERAPPNATAVLRRSHDLACDWKTYVENYLEGYHIAAVHPALAADMDLDGYRVSVTGDMALQETRPRDGAADANAGLWAWLWPNLGVNVYRYGVMLEHMRPIAPGRTRLDYLYLYDPAVGGMDAVLETSDRLTGEDVAIVEAVQRNLDAGVYATGVLSPRHEGAVGWFQERVTTALNTPPRRELRAVS